MKSATKNVFLTFVSLVLIASAAVRASDAIPKEVNLIISGKRLVASNIRFSRFEELTLNAQERIAEQTESKGVLLVVTNQRFIAYGVGSGWKTIKTEAGEATDSVRVEDFAAFINTNKRFLNFNGETGVWGMQDRKTER